MLLVHKPLVIATAPLPVFQVRNLCYMVTRREKMKHTLCDLQEKIFHLQIQLLEEDMAGGKGETKCEHASPLI